MMRDLRRTVIAPFIAQVKPVGLCSFNCTVLWHDTHTRTHTPACTHAHTRIHFSHFADCSDTVKKMCAVYCS